MILYDIPAHIASTCSKNGQFFFGQTNIPQTFSARSRARPGPCFGQPNVRYQSQNLSKVVPKTSGGFLLRGQLMSTSGFSSVVGTLLKLRLRRNNVPARCPAPGRSHRLCAVPGSAGHHYDLWRGVRPRRGDGNVASVPWGGTAGGNIIYC